MKVGLIGLGFMGRGHLDIYERFAKEGSDVELVCICDIDEKKFKGEFIKGNIDVGNNKYDFTKYRLYTDYKEMIEKEQLDYVDIALPTYLHCEASVYALNHGLHVMCEKPMAMNVTECEQMTKAAKDSGKKLMIGQCLRFWPHYEYLKACVEDKRFGNVVCAYFFRGGDPPIWSYENWLLTKDKSGGCLLDQHIHDVDTINWLFGMPDAVSAAGVNVIPGSGYDAVSTNYYYTDKVVNAQDDWTLRGGFGFEMIFRVNFEKGNLIFTRDGKLSVCENGGEKFYPELEPDSGYYRELVYFTNAIRNNTDIETATPESTMATIEIAEKEFTSADNGGQLIKVK